MGDYLWDRSGEADPEVKRLEETLKGLRYQPESFIFPAKKRWWPQLLVAAILLAMSALGFRYLFLQPVQNSVPTTVAATSPVSPNIPASIPLSPSTSSFAVASLTGVPKIDESPIPEGGQLQTGQWLYTDKKSRARIEVSTIGTVEVAPESQIRLVETGPSQHRLALAQGFIQASVSAPPRLFIIDTPSVTAVDLGCEYDMEIDKEGNGSLSVHSGWVSLEGNDYISTVPAGASSHIFADRGPGIPFFSNTPLPFQQALFEIDKGNIDEKSLRTLFLYAQPIDALSFWHLLPRVDREKREEIFDWIDSHYPLPNYLEKEQILSLEPEALQVWEEALFQIF